MTVTHKSKGWKAARIVHLHGGCRAVNGFDPNVRFDPNTLNGGAARFKTRSYVHIYSDIQGLGLSIIGSDFISNTLELNGRIPPNWRCYYQFQDTAFPCEDEADRWSHIGHAAYSRNNSRLWDIASRIAHQLRACSWRLRQISEAYRDQLDAHLKSGDFSPGVRFEDRFTWLGYLSIQAFLVDACVLRDYMAEFYATFACPDSFTQGKSRITSLAGLKRTILDKIVSSDIVTNGLKLATSEGGWLYELGCYRDLVIHSAPLAKARGRLVAVPEELALGSSGSLPSIRLPLPLHPELIMKQRANAEHYESFVDDVQAFMRANFGESPSTDGLTYSHAALGRLTLLARQLGDKSPVAPEVPHLGPSDIVSMKLNYE